ncbi:hypothetical protein CTAYLR_008825 [Chrysophaeum taylorii]|uniref:Glycosyltransferase family 92 protein n=1 Tax=Chrysophaeum taylorii TaxID=2483200 RepID=A0AAD7UCB4_9STRA|nr:hypothetical protein CTAYLR_008825 [Chrysophaeum taylorii]
MRAAVGVVIINCVVVVGGQSTREFTFAGYRFADLIVTPFMPTPQTALVVMCGRCQTPIQRQDNFHNKVLTLCPGYHLREPRCEFEGGRSELRSLRDECLACEVPVSLLLDRNDEALPVALSNHIHRLETAAATWPWKENRSWNVALATIAREEFPIDWLEWHLASGVEHFFVYRDATTFDASVVAPFVARGLVTLVSWVDRKGLQGERIRANHARFAFGAKAKWFGIVDTDTYFVPHVHHKMLVPPTLGDVSEATVSRHYVARNQTYALKIALRRAQDPRTCGEEVLPQKKVSRLLRCTWSERKGKVTATKPLWHFPPSAEPFPLADGDLDKVEHILALRAWRLRPQRP